MWAHLLLEQVVALAVAASSIRQLFSDAMLLRGISVHLTRSDQQQQASFVVQVLEALLRSYARLLAEPSGAAAAAAAKHSCTQNMLDCCSSVVLRAPCLVDSASSLLEVGAQQVLLASMSAMQSALSMLWEGTGAHSIFMCSLSVQTFAAMQSGPPCAEVDVQPLAACMLLIGSCLLCMSEQIAMSDPGGHSFYDWEVASCGLLGGRGREMPESSRLVAGVQDLLSTVQVLQAAAERNGRFAADAMLQRCEKVGWCPDAVAAAKVMSHASRVQEVLACLCAAVSEALQPGQLSEFDTEAQLLAVCHWVTHVLAASRVLSEVVEQHAQVLLDSARSGVLQQQQQGRQGLSPAVRDALVGLASGFRAVGGVLCAAQPNHLFCNNPACRSAASVSAGFALVRGEGVVCGGCLGLARGEAVPEGWVAARYCSVACQQQHFACHKACYHDAVWGDAQELTSRVLQAAADAQRISTAQSFCSCCSGASPGSASAPGHSRWCRHSWSDVVCWAACFEAGAGAIATAQHMHPAAPAGKSELSAACCSGMMLTPAHPAGSDRVLL